jgi:hypothetical protein
LKNIIFIADFFTEDTRGGAELHDDVVIRHLDSKGLLHSKVRSTEVSLEFLENNKDKKFIIGNFVGLPFASTVYLAQNCEYVIYEHDYKFLDVRNPITFANFIAPKRHLINVNFYKSAKKVICLSKMHRSIFDNNLGFDNIVNTNCSMWSDEDLEFISSINNGDKVDKKAVIKSSNPIKKTRETVNFCRQKDIDFELIASSNYHEFLTMLSKYSGLVFMTGHPEPTPRIAIEAKMLNCNFLSQKQLISVAHEDYFDLKGNEMIECVRDMREKALEKIIGWTYEV